MHTADGQPPAGCHLCRIRDEISSHKQALAQDIKLDGFTMLGAYPDGAEWDFNEGSLGDHEDWATTWAIPKPARDPVLGESQDGLCGQWKDE